MLTNNYFVNTLQNAVHSTGIEKQKKSSEKIKMCLKEN
jgi:hypothetical protein